MRQRLAILALALLLASCGGKEKEKDEGAEQQKNETPAPAYAPVAAPSATPVAPGGLTANEQSGLKDIADFYGGKCQYSTGVEDGKKFFRIEVSRSNSLDSNKQITELNASNIALLFYKDLRQERSTYGEIQAVIKFNDGQEVTKTYTRDKLEVVVAKMMVVFKMADLLRDKKYDEIGPLLNENSGFATYNKPKLIDQIKKAEGSLGNVKQFIPYGFVFLKADNKKPVLHIAGVLVRDRQNNEFSVDFDPASSRDEAIFLNYKL